jgi:predicted RNase H-like nuclease (RuvC/YqgF family)
MEAERVSEHPEERVADLERRVEALRRTNEELGRELIEQRAGQRPRSPATAGRAVEKLTSARDRAEAALADKEAEVAGLRHENEALRLELNRLRGGNLGLLRRACARLLRR